MRQQRHGLWLSLAVLVAGLAFLVGTERAQAAEFAGDERYVLERGQVISDDFYVSGGEVIIDGTVEGDLVVAGGHVEVNGVIMGDVIAAGGAIVIAGVVQDDVRAAGGAVIVTGSIGDDLIAAAGGGWPGMVVSANNRTIPQGLQIAAGASIGGDAYLGGGQATVSGAIGRNLFTAMRALVLAARVGGNATLMGETINIDERTRVQGTLTYRTSDEISVPEGIAARVVREVVPDIATTVVAPRNPFLGFLDWVMRTLLILAGLALLGWLAWSFAPNRLTTAVAVMDARPVEAAIYGLLVAVAVLPVSAALVFVAVLFWGWFPGGVAMLTFLFGLFALLWLFSPVVAGLWVGRKLAAITGLGRGDMTALLLGVAAIVIAGRLLTLIPFMGELAFRAVYLLSFALTVGAWILARRQAAAPSAAPVPAAITAAD